MEYGQTERQAALERVAQAARECLKDLGEDGVGTHSGLEAALQDLGASKPDGCVAKYPGEPTFTLVGRDKLSTKVLPLRQ